MLSKVPPSPVADYLEASSQGAIAQMLAKFPGF